MLANVKMHSVSSQEFLGPIGVPPIPPTHKTNHILILKWLFEVLSMKISQIRRNFSLFRMFWRCVISILNFGEEVGIAVTYLSCMNAQRYKAIVVLSSSSLSRQDYRQILWWRCLHGKASCNRHQSISDFDKLASFCFQTPCQCQLILKKLWYFVGRTCTVEVLNSPWCAWLSPYSW